MFIYLACYLSAVTIQISIEGWMKKMMIAWRPTLMIFWEKRGKGLYGLCWFRCKIMIKFPKPMLAFAHISMSHVKQQLFSLLLTLLDKLYSGCVQDIIVFFFFSVLVVSFLNSARIAREEDERELRMIEEEERRERMRKEAKKRKLTQRWL